MWGGWRRGECVGSGEDVIRKISCIIVFIMDIMLGVSGESRNVDVELWTTCGC